MASRKSSKAPSKFFRTCVLGLVAFVTCSNGLDCLADTYTGGVVPPLAVLILVSRFISGVDGKVVGIFGIEAAAAGTYLP